MNKTNINQVIEGFKKELETAILETLPTMNCDWKKVTVDVFDALRPHTRDFSRELGRL